MIPLLLAALLNFAHAGEFCATVDPIVSALEQLTTELSWKGEPSIQRDGKKFDITAAAEVVRTPEQLFELALDYESYRSKGIQSILEAKIISRGAGTMKVWFKTTAAGQTASYYVDVTAVLSGDKRKAWLSWVLASPPAPQNPRYPDTNSVKSLSGSWKIASVADGRSQVEYQMSFEPRTSRLMPGPVVGAMLTPAFRTEVTAMFTALSK